MSKKKALIIGAISLILVIFYIVIKVSDEVNNIPDADFTIENIH